MQTGAFKSAHENEFTEQYYTPEYIQVAVTEPVTIEENGKKSYTTYKITTTVSN